MNATALVAAVEQMRAEQRWLARPPVPPCQWCGAEAGPHCLAAGRRQPASTRLYLAPDGCHPSKEGCRMTYIKLSLTPTWTTSGRSRPARGDAFALHLRRDRLVRPPG